jgi:hypothetical protein
VIDRTFDDERDEVISTLNGNGELHATRFGLYGSCNAPNCTFVTGYGTRRSVLRQVRRHLELDGVSVRWVASREEK